MPRMPRTQMTLGLGWPLPQGSCRQQQAARARQLAQGRRRVKASLSLVCAGSPRPPRLSQSLALRPATGTPAGVAGAHSTAVVADLSRRLQLSLVLRVPVVTFVTLLPVVQAMHPRLIHSAHARRRRRLAWLYPRPPLQNPQQQAQDRQSAAVTVPARRGRHPALTLDLPERLLRLKRRRRGRLLLQLRVHPQPQRRLQLFVSVGRLWAPALPRCKGLRPQRRRKDTVRWQ